jgi:hypothetical protein
MTQQQLRKMAKPNLPGFIVLGKGPSTNAYVGTVELSFAMDLSKDRTQFYWSHDNATSNFGGKFKIDGRKDAEARVEQLAKAHPDHTWEIFDVHDDNLPVLMDWDDWRWGSTPSEKKLSGVMDKFIARNPRFYMIEDEPPLPSKTV